MNDNISRFIISIPATFPPHHTSYCTTLTTTLTCMNDISRFIISIPATFPPHRTPYCTTLTTTDTCKSCSTSLHHVYSSALSFRHVHLAFCHNKQPRFRPIRSDLNLSMSMSKQSTFWTLTVFELSDSKDFRNILK